MENLSRKSPGMQTDHSMRIIPFTDTHNVAKHSAQVHANYTFIPQIANIPVLHTVYRYYLIIMMKACTGIGQP
jgi:hypothetical protein